MQVALIHRNHNTANAHAVGHASPLVDGTLRIDGQKPFYTRRGGKVSPRKKHFFDL